MADLFGVDCDCVDDLPLRHDLATPRKNLANAIARRITTPRGALAVVGEDEDYGYDIRELLNDGVTPAELSKAQQDIARECEKDERILTVDSIVTHDVRTQTLTIALTVIPNDDEPFSFILEVDAVTIKFVQGPQ